MKKLLITATATLVCVGAFAQGTLSFGNNSDQLIYLTTDKTHLLAADGAMTVAGAALAGSSLYSGAGGTMASLTGTPSFTAALFAGPTAGSLALVATTTFLDVNFGGKLSPTPVVIAGAPAGTTYFFNFEIYDSRATSFANAQNTVNPANPTGSLSEYAGQSGVFSAVLQGVPSPIYQTASPVSSTMVHGTTFVPNDYAGYPGYFGSIKVDAAIVPEPGTLALAGLGLATLLALRRRS
jgi:hypothetical protein